MKIPIETSQKFVAKGSIYDKVKLFQVIAWLRTGDKPLAEIMMALCSVTSASLGPSGLYVYIYVYL